MTVAWQRNLATTTAKLENYNTENSIIQDTHTYISTRKHLINAKRRRGRGKSQFIIALWYRLQ